MESKNIKDKLVFFITWICTGMVTILIWFLIHWYNPNINFMELLGWFFIIIEEITLIVVTYLCLVLVVDKLIGKIIVKRKNKTKR